MGRITPVERNTDVLRPYGVFACIAPFNFPLALSAGMSSAALVAGNAVVYKPAEETPLDRAQALRDLRDAGLPPGVFNFLVGRREEIGDAVWQHPGVDGVVFTGSKAVGLRIWHGLSERWIKPCLMELGGKNAAVVMPSADLDAAAEGVMRSAFSLQNQKCSATSRVYVASRRRGDVPGAAAGEDPGDPDGRSHRARRVLRAGHQPAGGRALRASGARRHAGRARSCWAASG